MSFGVVSAVGGLAGAILTVVFGLLMMLAGVLSVSGRGGKANIGSWAIGGVSGFFGGIVGNQGDLRAAGLTGFRLKITEFL